MKIWHSLESIAYPQHKLVLALGNFDGVHRGHQELLASMVRHSRQGGMIPAVFLFHPHPQNILNPANSPKMLLDLDKKLDLLAVLGIEAAFVIDFDNCMASLDAEEFVRTILVEKLHVAGVFVGFNYRFGRKALGTPEVLERLGERYGLQVTVIPPVYVAGTLVSSTTIRAALDGGDIAQARELLGFWPIIRGKVVHGEHRGRLLGFPTANITASGDLITPCTGVYAGSARVAGAIYAAVINIGSHPTFENSRERLIEAHLLQLRDSIYGEMIELEIFRKLRDERRFSSPEELVSQIKRDIMDALEISGEVGAPC